jgi:hypothetical protein
MTNQGSLILNQPIFKASERGLMLSGLLKKKAQLLATEML